MSGLVIVQTKGELQHQGVSLTMEGLVNLQLSSKSVGLFEAFYSSLKVCFCAYINLMVRWVVRSILHGGGPIELFFVPVSAPRLV